MLLLIPGPVTTRPEVREALRYDFAPWDNDFRPLYAGIRERVLHIAHGVPGEHATLPLQGCGHFITEAAIRTFVPLGHRRLRRPHDPAGARGRPRPGAAAVIGNCGCRS
jgi:2-aminoethylphosphonate-pyruvate transaminase